MVISLNNYICCVYLLHRIYLPFNEDSSNSGGVNFVFGLVNALVFVVIVVFMTFLLVILFKYKCYRVNSHVVFNIKTEKVQHRDLSQNFAH